MALKVFVWPFTPTKLPGLHLYEQLQTKELKLSESFTKKDKKQNHFGIIWVRELVNHVAWKSICARKLLGLFLSHGFSPPHAHHPLQHSHLFWGWQWKRLQGRIWHFQLLSWPGTLWPTFTDWDWHRVCALTDWSPGPCWSPQPPRLASEWDRDLNMQRQDREWWFGTVSIHHGFERKRDRLCRWYCLRMRPGNR